MPRLRQAGLVQVSLPLAVTRDSDIHIAHAWRCPACGTGIISNKELLLVVSAVSEKFSESDAAQPIA